MSTIPRTAGVRQRLWTKQEYYRLGELGFFHGQRVELIEGKLMVLSPQNAPHAGGVMKALAALQAAFATGYLVRPQLPIDLGQTSEPEPDLAVVAGNVEQFLQAHPTSAVLIVEVADSSLSYDRNRKASLYARAGIADYWIVNLVDNQVEVYRDPVPDPTQHYGFRYASRTDFVAGTTIHPVAQPHAAIAASSLLP
jgi:Uma2 family endonuclease